MRMRYKTTLASILLFSISFVSVAQDIGDNPPPPMPPPPPGLPVDGSLFVFVLFSLGLFIGIKKIKALDKEKLN